MPFQYILANLLAESDDAVGVIFLDDQGETVDLACADFATPYDLRVMGAYLGIYLRQVEEVAESAGLGEPRMIHIERSGLHVFAEPLTDGYHVALVQRRPTLVARARQNLSAAAAELNRQVFSD